jgi:two-component system phosphate regulon response regulator PhoB
MDPNQPALKVVIVEDNASLADIYKTRLEVLGYEVYCAYDGEQALYLIEKALPNLVLLDLMVPKVAGDQILARMRASEWGKNIKVLIVSNLNEADAPAGLRQQGIEGYAVKANLSNDQLDDLVNRILKPEGQTEDVSLEKTDEEPALTPVATTTAPVAVAPAPLPVAPTPAPVMPAAPAAPVATPPVAPTAPGVPLDTPPPSPAV